MDSEQTGKVRFLQLQVSHSGALIQQSGVPLLSSPLQRPDRQSAASLPEGDLTATVEMLTFQKHLSRAGYLSLLTTGCLMDTGSNSTLTD